jgi:hypothetical protein
MYVNVCAIHLQAILMILYMWYLSSVFKCFPFLCVLSMSILSVIPQLRVCPVFNTWFEYPELLLIFLIAYIYFLYLVWNALPVCLMHFSGHSKHFMW